DACPRGGRHQRARPEEAEEPPSLELHRGRLDLEIVEQRHSDASARRTSASSSSRTSACMVITPAGQRRAQSPQRMQDVSSLINAAPSPAAKLGTLPSGNLNGSSLALVAIRASETR